MQEAIQPLVSVIIPTYNWKKEWFIKAVDSVLNQTYTNFELIIINDASTNDIEKTILDYKEKDNRIIYLKNKKNLKQAASRNKWINIAKGKYIAFIDDDDIRINNEKIKEQVNFMEKEKDYDLCWTNVIVMNENKQETKRSIMRQSDHNIKNHILQSNQFACSSVMIRKKEYYLFDANLWWLAEDYELWCNIWTHAKFYNLNIYGLWYRINLSGTTQTNKYKMKKEAFKVFRKYRKNYPNATRAFVFRIIERILPEKITQFILNIIRKLDLKNTKKTHTLEKIKNQIN